jgi:hypothetical protein
MKRISILALVLLVAAVAASSSSARRIDLPGLRLSPAAFAPNLGTALDSRLARIALSANRSGSGAALATARSQGVPVTRGKVRVTVYVRPGHVAGARHAVRLVHGNVLVTRGKLIDALLPARSLQTLAASRHVVRLQPARMAAGLSTVATLRPGVVRSHLADMSGFAYIGSGSGSGSGFDFGFSPDTAVPDPPTDVFVEPGDGQVVVSFTPPASNGGTEIVYYTATASPGGQSASSTGDPITVAGLTNGVEYTFTVTATNGIGTSGDSLTSDPVTPEGSSRLNPDPPAQSPRPAVPGIPGTPSRSNPHHNVPEF